MPRSNRLPPPRRYGITRETDLRRSGGGREPREAILVVTNGKETERQYLDALAHKDWVRPAMKVRFENGSPLDVVRSLARTVAMDEFDEGWAVVDLDDYQPADADSEAHASGPRLLWSVPCFEFWLLLHFESRTVAISDARRCEELLKRHLPDWDKTKLRFQDFAAGVDDAVRRSKDMPQPLANPSTSLWELIERLKR